MVRCRYGISEMHEVDGRCQATTGRTLRFGGASFVFHRLLPCSQKLRRKLSACRHAVSADDWARSSIWELSRPMAIIVRSFVYAAASATGAQSTGP